jgi:pimeloyl-ACP methyl ester carboxylesterase
MRTLEVLHSEARSKSPFDRLKMISHLIGRYVMKTKLSVLCLTLITVAALSACAAESVTPTPQEPVRVTTMPTPTPTPSTDFVTFSIEAADGATLTARFYPPETSPAPGVLLLHMWQRQKGDWASFASRLQQEGYAAMTLDLRGHGASEGTAAGTLDQRLWTDDIVRAWTVMAEQPSVDVERTAIVGASIGANVALRAAAFEDRVQAVVLLSPGLDYHGITTLEAMTEYGDRPALIVASQEDAYAAESAEELAQGGKVLTLYPGSGHGTELLATQPDVVNLMLGWLNQQLE